MLKKSPKILGERVTDGAVKNALLIFCVLVVFLSGCTYSGPAAEAPKQAQTGAVIFYMPSAQEGKVDTPIYIEMPSGPPARSKITRTYKRPFPSTTPVCGTEGSANFTLPPGWFSWSSDRRCDHPAVVDGGSIEIKAGVCLKVEVSNLWGCPLGMEEHQK